MEIKHDHNRQNKYATFSVVSCLSIEVSIRGHLKLNAIRDYTFLIALRIDSMRKLLSIMFQKVKTFLTKNNREQWLLFALFVFTIFLQCSLFQWFCFHSVLISSLWKCPFAFFQFWGGKLVPALFLASFIFIIKKTWWTIIVHIICDIWFVANLFYYKANSLFLSFETMKMADNMSGFWNSLYAYMGWDIISFFLVTIVYVIALLAF